MKKKMWLIPVGIVAVVILVVVGAMGYMRANSLSFSVGQSLVANNGEYIMVLDDSPVCMSNVNDKEGLFDNIGNGDKILVLHDGINDTYPGKTGAYAVFKLDDGAVSDISKSVLSQLTEMGWLSAEVYKLDNNLYAGGAFEVTGSKVTFINDQTALYEKSLNFDKMDTDSIFNIPVFKFETMQDAEDFIAFFEDEYLSDGAHGDIDDFKDKIKAMGDEYFDEYTVFVMYVITGSGATDVDVHSVYNDGENLCIHVAKTTLEGVGGVTVMSGFLYTVAIEKESVKNCTSFDADENNF
ncbi:MAG: hypothetical protein IJZ35_06700 [Clostridia bacterium]|nr:hypothetical protein [Clostridia bacterium]